MRDILRKHKKAAAAAAFILTAVLLAGCFVPVKIEVRQTGALHQHTALTEDDFAVQTSTLFGFRQDADGYTVRWDGWTEEEQAAVLGQRDYEGSGDETEKTQPGLTEYEDHGAQDTVADESILKKDREKTESREDNPVLSRKQDEKGQSRDHESDSGKADRSETNTSDKGTSEKGVSETGRSETGNSEKGTSETDCSETDTSEADSSARNPNREKNPDGEKDQPEDKDRRGNEQEKAKDDLVVTGDTVTDYTISKGSLTDSIKVDAVPVAEIQAAYEGTLYYLEVPDPENIKACLLYEDGAKAAVSCTAEIVPECTGAADIPVHTQFGDTVCHVEPIMPAELSAEYRGTVHAGDTAEASDVEVTVTFEDGYTIKTKADEFEGDALVNDTGVFYVKNAYGEANVQIDPVPITGAYIRVDKILYEEDLLEFDEITLTYEDGETKVVGKDEVEVGAEATLPLTSGKNEIPFIYNGKMYSFTVDVLHDNEIRRASIRYADEIRTAEYSHFSDTIMVTVNRYTEAEYTYLLTHIIIDDPCQIHAGLSNDDYGGERETPSSAAQRLHWIVGINGSNFDYSTNTPTMADAKIKNGQVMPDSKMVANGMEICLTNGGNLFSPQQGMTVGDLLNMGVTDTWCCGDTLLISNGEAVNVGIQSLDYRYPRTAIGMVRPCEYYLITAGSAGYSNGMTYDEIRDTLMDLNCGFGKCLDGGGSSTLIFENQMLNSPATGSERPVTDFLYFTE